MNLNLLAALGALVSLASAIPVHGDLPKSEGNCSKPAMQAAADAYIAAQTAGKLDSLQTVLAEKWLYIEDNKEIDVKDGILKKALKIDHRRTNFDLVDCATYTEVC
jgi:hypothetical protein